ncbi:MAG: ABC transporter permease [Oscillospiraceae bacterium]
MKAIKEIYAYRHMITSLVRKDLRGRYKGSVLGFLWTFINPLLQLMVYNVVFATILKTNIDKYYLFLFVALIPWIFFQNALTGGSSCILSQKGLITKIYFPREVVPIAHVTSGFVNMLLCFIVVFIVVLFSGVSINPIALLYLPIVFIIEYILALGIAFVTSAITVYFRDLEHILGIVSMAWMYLTPIMYSLEIVPKEYKSLFMLNPMTSIITAYRDILYYGRIPQMDTLLHALSFGFIVLLIGIITFSLLKKRFAEEL